MSEKLLPCPFCGGRPTFISPPGAEICGQIVCTNEDCFGPRTTAGTKQDSIVQWNTRSNPSLAQLAAARSALAPFAEIADSFDFEGRVLRDEDGIYANTAGDFRRARDAHSMLAQAPPINGWDPRYRVLREGDIIREGDECLTDSHLGWQPETRCVGTLAPDPSYTSHRMYRRLIDTAQDGVAQRIEQSEPDEGRKDAGSTPVAVAPAQEPAGQSEAKPIAWQWRYAGDAEWHTPSGGQKLSDNVLQRERPIEQRPLYAHPTVKVSGDAAEWQPIETAPFDQEVLLGWWNVWPERSWEVAAGLYGSTKGGWRHGQATHWMSRPAPPDTPAQSNCEVGHG